MKSGGGSGVAPLPPRLAALAHQALNAVADHGTPHLLLGPGVDDDGASQDIVEPLALVVNQDPQKAQE